MPRNRKEKEERMKICSVKVLRAKEYKETVFLDLELNGVCIYGCRYVEGKNGDFISFPSHKGKDGKYYNYAWADLPEDLIESINNQIDELLK